MAKKKSNPKAKDGLVPVAATERQKNIVALRGTAEWKEWLDSLATANNAPITVTIEQALRELSDRLKHRKPPRRMP